MTRGGGRRRDEPDHRVVYGVHPVRELLRADAEVRGVWLDAGRRRTPDLEDLRSRALEAGVAVEEVSRQEVDRLAGEGVHQGVVAVAAPFPYRGLTEVLAAVPDGVPPLLVALDHVTDPHNLGSVARVAEAAGAHGLVLPRRRAAPVTPAAEKAAAGALAHLPVALVGNLGQALAHLEDRAVWRVGLAAEAETTLYACALLTEPLVLVAGSEWRGLGRTSQLHCDQLIRLPMCGHVGSLNTSVAAGVVLYEAYRQRTDGR